MQAESEIAHPYEDFYDRLYVELNPSGTLEVDAKTAANFLKGSNLDVMQLSQIWELADYRKKGSLDRRGVFIAFKLIAGAQQGHPILPGVLGAVLDAPKFPTLSSSSYSPASRMASPSVDWDIDVAEQSKYEAIFYSLSPVNGKLTGDRVRPVLLNSQLQHQTLARIWELADVDRDGMLDKYEMCIALHLVYKCLQNEPLPNALPVSLVHPTKRGTLSRRTSYVGTPSTPTLPAPPPARPSLSASSRTSSVSSLTKGMGDHPALDSPARSAMTPIGKSILDMKTGEWPIDKNLYDQEFRRYDTDMDGLVTGMDVKIPLMGSGIPQQHLAHIWALVDISKSGKLNLEQFALIMELIREAKQGVILPEILPAHLVPYSLRFGSTMAPSLALSDSSNPRIQELNEEIQKIIEDRRKADQDLLQLDADTTVKNSEIKNLEIELSTLSATVKQLQHQKGEAYKRLRELDDKIDRLETTCQEQAERLTQEEDRLNKVKADLAASHDNFNAEEEILQSLRAEVMKLEDKYAQIQTNFNQENAKMISFVDQLTQMESKIDQNSKEITRIEKLTEDLQKTLSELEKIDTPTNEEVIFKQFEKLSVNNTPKSNSQGALADPFKHDPFENAHASPFNADPFSGKSAFSSAPFGQPTFGRQEEDPFGHTDPFANTTPSSNSGFGTSDFADFAKFSSFSS